MQRPERAAPAAEGGLRGARLGLPAHHPQRRPREPTTRARRLHGLRRPVGLEALDPEDLPRRRGGQGGRPRRQLPRERILTEGGRAVGVEGLWIDPAGPAANGTPVPVTVRAPVIVVAGGSIESPALLLRSGIGGPAVGDSSGCIPTSAVTGVYPEDQRWWWAPPQAAMSHQFADLEDGYGFLIESAQSTTGLYAASDALDLRPGPQGEDARLETSAPRSSTSRATAGTGGSTSTLRATRSRATPSPTISTSATSGAGSLS